MASLSSCKYVQIHQIDDTAERIAYTLIRKYRAQLVDGISVMRGHLFLRLLKYYVAMGIIFMFFFLTLVSIKFLPTAFFVYGLIVSIFLGTVSYFWFKQDKGVYVYSYMLEVMQVTYDKLDESLLLNKASASTNQGTLCDQLNTVEGDVKFSSELINKPYCELAEIYKKNRFLA